MLLLVGVFLLSDCDVTQKWQQWKARTRAADVFFLYYYYYYYLPANVKKNGAEVADQQSQGV